MTGFAHMSDTDRQEAGRFWLDALEAYTVEEVRSAFVDFARSGGQYPNPQAIISQIVKARQADIPGGAYAHRPDRMPPRIQRDPGEVERMADMGRQTLHYLQQRGG